MIVLCNFEKSIGWGPSGSARVRTMWDPHPPNNIDTNGNRTSLLRVRARVQSRLFCQFLVDRRSRISRRTCDRQQAKIPPDGSDPGRSIPPREPKKESSALNRVRRPWENELSGGHSFILFCQCIMCDDIPRETLDGSYVNTLRMCCHHLSVGSMDSRTIIGFTPGQPEWWGLFFHGSLTITTPSFVGDTIWGDSHRPIERAEDRLVGWTGGEIDEGCEMMMS